MSIKREKPLPEPARISGNNSFSRREILALLGTAALGSTLSACSREEGTIPSPQATSPGPAPKLPDDLHYKSIREVARLIESKEISPVELTRRMLERIESLDGQLKSYATVTAERALATARQAEQEIVAGNYRGSLHGIPIAVKDLCYTKGTRTMGGMGVYKDFVPDFDATVVTRLENAGVVLLGKLNLTEGAMAGYHRDFDIPVNPWRADLWPGASSSGSGVATAAGLCFAALGSDTGGSIRFPSMANGIVGLKPTYGRVSRHGVLPLGETLDHVGPMTRHTADAAIMLQAMAGYDESDPTSLQDPVPDMLGDALPGIARMTVGFDRAFATEGIDSGLVSAIDQALETLRELGVSIVDIEMPEGIREIGEAWFPICAYEAHKAHAANFPSRANEYGSYFRDFLEIGAAVTDEQYAEASQYRAAFNQQFNAILENVDSVVCPAGGITFPLDPEIQYRGAAELDPLFTTVQMYFTIPADFAGTPALTVPCGFSTEGVPYAMQFMGARLSEPGLIRFGHAYEAATDWHKRHPSI
jgi:amidase